MGDLITRSNKELTRAEVMLRTLYKRVSQRQTAVVLHLSTREVKRLVSSYRKHRAPTRRVSRITPAVDEATSAFISAVAAACSIARLSRSQARASCTLLLASIWDATEPITGKLPAAPPPRSKSRWANQSERRKYRSRRRAAAAQTVSTNS
jgi:hypothetical protein